MLKQIIKRNTKTFGLFKFNKNFSEKIKKEEVLLYIMQDKYSVKPDKEFRISHTTVFNQSEMEIKKNKEILYKPQKVISYGKHSITEISSIKLKLKYKYENAQRLIKSKLLPRDYPYSVKEGYSGFSYYNLLANICFNAMNFLTTQVLINSLNLNISRTSGIFFSAGMNWAIKEGIGQMGSILFTTKYNQNIERYAKKWRLTGALLSSFSFLVESTTLIIPGSFLIIATSANIVKLISLNCIFISRTVIIENLAKENNLADLSNRLALHNNISMLFGNLLGLGFSLLIPLNHFATTFSVLFGLSLYNIYTSYKCLKYIDFNHFNFQRMSILFDEFFKSGNILTPAEVSKLETIVYRKYSNIKFCQESPEIIIHSDNKLYIVKSFNLFRDRNFFLYVKKSFNFKKLKNEHIISTFLRVNAENNDILWAFLFTNRLNYTLKIKSGLEIEDLIEENLAFLDEFDKKHFIEKLKNAGWSLNFSSLEEKYSRYHLLFKDT